ncbi:uncharacterized protein LOC117789763 [Drosophila innubila]|uniref:uncharacterized protein LOC117789763 n=1 Tax=Drosophila innubila TaxID=198719 RepID=UPI00148B8BC8|nr:uncharacterized protein LOC117789763 [Drosophila innubila]
MDIGPVMKQQQLQEYFETFGCVQELHLFPNQYTERTGYVIFENPRHAANALKTEKLHFGNNRFLKVQPSYSWHQPDAEKMPDKPEYSKPHEKSAAIMKLNDYCLSNIFRQLSLSDRIQLARTCYRFRYIYEEMSPMLDKSIDFEFFAKLTAWELRDFFQLSGRNVKNIKGRIPQDHFFLVCVLIGKHCINLQSMILENESATLNLFKIFANLNSLQNLEILGCDLIDESFKAIQHLSQLKKLTLSSNSMLTAKHLNYLPNSVESLTLKECDFLQDPEFLIIIFGSLPLLKELHIPDFIPETPCFEQLIKDNCCESLEFLSIGCGDQMLPDFNHIARLPSLKKLHLNIFPVWALVPPILMTWLVEYKFKQLEHFELDLCAESSITAEFLPMIGKLSALRTLGLMYCDAITDRGLEELFTLQDLAEININLSRNVTDNGVLRLILACPKLQVLNLEYCEKLTDKLLHDIILNLQDNQKNRPLPIKLLMFGTKVNESNLLNSNVAARNIIDVIF